MRGLAKGSEARADPHGLHLPPVPKARARFLETEEARGGVGSKDIPNIKNEVRLLIHFASATHSFFHCCFECQHGGQKQR